MKQLTDNCQMSYGKHKGAEMANIPADYLIWIYDNNKCDIRVKLYIEENMDVIQQELRDWKKQNNTENHE